MSDGAGTPHDHFARLVQRWSQFAPPLRPGPDDTALVQRAIDELGERPLRALLLGLTPEIAGCSWPTGTCFTAVDHSRAMIRTLWPPPARPAVSWALCGDWTRLPIRPGAADLVAGDGCYVTLTYPRGYRAFGAEVRRVLAPGGRFVIRVFVRPDVPEPLGAIAAGAVGSVHALKIRLWAALHGPAGDGVRLGDVWEAWASMRRPPGGPGWTADEIAGIESYRGLDTRYQLPTLAEMRAILAEDFDVLGCQTGTYEAADRCPTFTLAARSP